MGHFDYYEISSNQMKGKRTPHIPLNHFFLLTMETQCTCDCSAAIKYRLKYAPLVQLRQNCTPKSFTSGSQKWALNHHVNFREISSSRMVARIQWSRERPCVYRRPPLNHEGTYPDKLTNAENVLPLLHNVQTPPEVTAHTNRVFRMVHYYHDAA